MNFLKELTREVYPHHKVVEAELGLSTRINSVDPQLNICRYCGKDKYYNTRRDYCCSCYQDAKRYRLDTWRKISSVL